MRLYHTSSREIRDPDIHIGRKNADFGQGFYLTPDREFAFRWAQQGAVINEFELETEGLSVCRLIRDGEWADYIFRNRRAQDTKTEDVIIGPIANDTIYDTLGIISSGFLSPEEALRLLRIGPEYTQVAVKTEKAAGQLTWLGAYRMENVDEYKDILREEQAEYQKVFARAMQEMT